MGPLLGIISFIVLAIALGFFAGVFHIMIGLGGAPQNLIVENIFKIVFSLVLPGVGSGYVAGYLSENNPIKEAVKVLLILDILVIVIFTSFSNSNDAFMKAGVVVALISPSIWLGGYLRSKEISLKKKH